jgi:hypothetical protein
MLKVPVDELVVSMSNAAASPWMDGKGFLDGPAPSEVSSPAPRDSSCDLSGLGLRVIDG